MRDFGNSQLTARVLFSRMLGNPSTGRSYDHRSLLSSRSCLKAPRGCTFIVYKREKHIINCASSGNIRRFMYNLEPSCELGTVPLESVRNLSVPIMKDWIEEPVETYDPWKSTENRNVIRCKIGGSKSQKKQYRLAERKRIETILRENAFKPKLATRHKPKMTKQCSNISQLIQSLKRLSVEDFDALLESFNFSNLYISDIKDTLNKRKCISQVINTTLATKFKDMLLYRLKESIS
ncbi:uncharacterized protein LOC116427373 isoform X2 [Nomia melanderi]|uniref:uncharacterized protein LOC116427373 isoform X2 n=1 Tax=Nomia melanderi TaxID=2448451 RepID=UPI0013041DEA|nr:uncharacterized protein LOC116427373 isoform X2 [Nomia melanderi]